MTWPVNTLERAQELARWGVDGLISDRPGLIKSGIGADV
jgi:glycerophosphoryl diester phosphodiesterase